VPFGASLLRPVQANDKVDQFYRYGSTQNSTRQTHHGVEFANAQGTPIYAAASGRVEYAGDDREQMFSPWLNFYGNLVILAHEIDEQTIYTLYAHLYKIDVRNGESVTAGDKIGEVGATGAALGSHLHFEVRVGENLYQSTQNPEGWLEARRLENSDLSGRLMGGVWASGAPGSGYQMRAEYRATRDGNLRWAYDIRPYDAQTPPGSTEWEQFILGDLAPGWYRITLTHDGKLYERWVTVEAERTTQIIFNIP
jgi:hypothetical protein